MIGAVACKLWSKSESYVLETDPTGPGISVEGVSFWVEDIGHGMGRGLHQSFHMPQEGIETASWIMFESTMRIFGAVKACEGVVVLGSGPQQPLSETRQVQRGPRSESDTAIETCRDMYDCRHMSSRPCLAAGKCSSGTIAVLSARFETI